MKSEPAVPHPLPATGLRNIVIVGAGFAGTTLARELAPLLPPGSQIVLISEESYTTFHPMLAEVVGAAVFPEQVVVPVRQMIDRTARFVMGRVLAIDDQRREVHAQTLAGLLAIPYEHLVLAFGTRANLKLVPGLAEHALPIKLVGDALHARNRVLQRLARMELENDPAARRALGHIVVIGGGFSGVEVAGALADFLHGALRYYPRVHADELQVTLLHDGDALLPELPAPLGASAERSLLARGVQVRLRARAIAVDAGGVTLDGGELVPAATVICTVGTGTHPLADALPWARERGRIVVRPDLSVEGARHVWAVGDCARITNGRHGLAPPTAQFAVAEARCLAGNISAVLDGVPTRPFEYRSRGMMATTGHLKGVALVGPLRLGGLPAWLLWRAYYLALMPTWGRRVRIFIEWTWSMFFNADITHLRFTRTGDDWMPESDPRAAALQAALEAARSIRYPS